MFDIGFAELLVIGVIALLVLGPERLPQAARTTGRWVGKIRRMVSQATQEIDRQLKAEELREKLRKEGDTLGLEKIQKTVDDALSEARKYEHMVDKPSAESTSGGNRESTAIPAENQAASPNKQPEASSKRPDSSSQSASQ